jgi:hypothetical protein
MDGMLPVLNDPYELHVRPSVAATALTAAWLVTVSITVLLQLRPLGKQASSQFVLVLPARSHPPSAPGGKGRQASARKSALRFITIWVDIMSCKKTDNFCLWLHEVSEF